MARIVITTIGSRGDLHPYIAIGLELKRRRHEAILATGECYREYVESRGLGFRPVRPDCRWVSDAAIMRRYMHLRLGLIRLTRELLLPSLRETYEDTLAAVDGADLLISQVSLAARLVAEKTGMPWASTMHIPLFFFSACELPLVPLAPLVFKNLRFLGPWFWRPTIWLCKRASRFIGKPWYDLRTELGLPRAEGLNALLDSYSPTLVLALFSKLLADKQPDWPTQTMVTGFPFYDGSGQTVLASELSRFLDAGPPPLVFTLGTAVASEPGAFFEQSAAAARLLGQRAVLVLNDERNRPTALPDGVMAVGYAPFTQLLPRASVVVHHGGIGTTGLAMRAGRPMLVVPHAWDQPDNADRVARLGIARTLWPQRYTPERIAGELRHLQNDPAYMQRSSQVAEQICRENGIATACDQLERLL